METYHGYIDSTNDALLVFEACRVGLLKCVQRRLSEDERVTIKSGSIYVWDEDVSGIKRWTDGKCWSPSRVNGCFLTYQELENKKASSSGTDEPKEVGSKLKERASTSSDLGSTRQLLDPTSIKVEEDTDEDSSVKKSGLIKKAISVFTHYGNKLHLICYYKKDHVLCGKLTSPSMDPTFKKVTIPRGMYPEMVPELIHNILDCYPLSTNNGMIKSDLSSGGFSIKRNKQEKFPSTVNFDSHGSFQSLSKLSIEGSASQKDQWLYRKPSSLSFPSKINTSPYQIAPSGESSPVLISPNSVQSDTHISYKDFNHTYNSANKPGLDTLASLAIKDSLSPLVSNRAQAEKYKNIQSPFKVKNPRLPGRSNSVSLASHVNLPFKPNGQLSTRPRPLSYRKSISSSYRVATPYFHPTREDKRQLAALRSTMFKI